MPSGESRSFAIYIVFVFSCYVNFKISFSFALFKMKNVMGTKYFKYVISAFPGASTQLVSSQH